MVEENSQGDSQPNEQSKLRNPDLDEDLGENSSGEVEAESDKELRERSKRELDQDKLQRHVGGTQQVETVACVTKLASMFLLFLSVAGAIIVFALGVLALPQFRELFCLPSLLSKPPHWQTYLLLIIPTTITAILSMTLWITGLRFASHIYGSAGQEDEEEADTAKEYLKVAQTIASNSSG